MKYKILKIDQNLDGIIKKGNFFYKIPFVNVKDEVKVEKFVDKYNISDYKLERSFNNPKDNNIICKYFTICGSCKGQHFSKEEYINHKMNNIKNILRSNKINFSDIIFEHHLCDPYKKRRRASFSVNGILCGFKKYRSNQIVEIDKCPLLTDNINWFLKKFKYFLVQTGNVHKILEIKVNDVKGDLDILVIAKNNFDVNLLKSFQDIFQEKYIAQIYWKKEQDKNWREPLIIKKIPKLDYYNYQVEFPNGNFLQAEKWGEDTIHKYILSFINNSANSKDKNMLDLFCGLGSYMYLLKDYFECLKGYDFAKETISKINKLNISNIKAYERDLLNHPIKKEELNKIDTVIINPPRKGAQKQIREILKAKVTNIIMIYCNTVTLGRDLKILLENNDYSINNFVAVDQFIFSAQIELVVTLSSSDLKD